MQKRLLLSLVMASAAWLIPAHSLAPKTPLAAAAPAWFQKHLEEQMAHGGRSIGDNADYMGPGEPAEAYGIEWKWGLGKQSLSGRLYAIVGGVEQADAWQMRSFWHPGKGQAMVLQFGADGTFAEGWMRPRQGGGIEMEQIFYGPDGNSRAVRHELSEFQDGAHEGSSFKHSRNGWQEERSYLWLVDKRKVEQQD